MKSVDSYHVHTIITLYINLNCVYVLVPTAQ